MKGNKKLKISDRGLKRDVSRNVVIWISKGILMENNDKGKLDERDH